MFRTKKNVFKFNNNNVYFEVFNKCVILKSFGLQSKSNLTSNKSYIKKKYQNALVHCYQLRGSLVYTVEMET